MLPFTNMSGDKGQEYFADGMTEDLITDLSKRPNLFVIARNSSFAFRDQKLALSEIGRKLGVKFIVEGSVRRHGDRLRVNAKLVNVNTKRSVWADRFDGKLDRIFDFQDMIINRIVAAITGELSDPAAKSADQSKQRVSTAAYEKFLLARSSLRLGSVDSVEQAIKYFHAALELEANYAEAHAGLATSYLMVQSNYWTIHLNMLSALPLAEQHAKKALAIRPVAQAQAVLADLAIRRGDWAAARAAAETALRLSPNDPLLMADMARIFALDGQPGKSLALAEQAKRLDPQFSTLLDFAHSISLYVNDRFAEAEKVAKRAAKIQGSTTTVNLRMRATVLIASIASQGRYKEAAKLLSSLCADSCSTEYAMKTWPFRREVDRKRLYTAWENTIKATGFRRD